MNKKVKHGVKFLIRRPTMKIMKGKGEWLCIEMKGKKFIMKAVDSFYWEK